jgi:hypothetical protein
MSGKHANSKFFFYHIFIIHLHTYHFLGNTLGNMSTAKKRIFSGIPPPSNKANNKNDACRKSN